MKCSHGRFYPRRITFHAIHPHYKYSGGIDGTWTVYKIDGTVLEEGISTKNFNERKASFEAYRKEELDDLKASNS